MSRDNGSKRTQPSRQSSRIPRTIFAFALIAVLAILFMSMQFTGSTNVAGAEFSTRISPDIVKDGGYCVLSEISLQQRVDNSTIIAEG